MCSVCFWLEWQKNDVVRTSHMTKFFCERTPHNYFKLFFFRHFLTETNSTRSSDLYFRIFNIVGFELTLRPCLYSYNAFVYVDGFNFGISFGIFSLFSADNWRVNTYIITLNIPVDIFIVLFKFWNAFRTNQITEITKRCLTKHGTKFNEAF